MARLCVLIDSSLGYLDLCFVFCFFGGAGYFMYLYVDCTALWSACTVVKHFINKLINVYPKQYIDLYLTRKKTP